jgi:hypothetical protein
MDRHRSPKTSYTDVVKIMLLREQGLLDSGKTQYELDHYIRLELGGDPKSADNLWLQPWGAPWERGQGSAGDEPQEDGMRGDPRRGLEPVDALCRSIPRHYQ